MQHEKVDLATLQPFKGGFYGPDDMTVRKIVTMRKTWRRFVLKANAAFRRNDELVAPAGVFQKGLSKNALTGRVSVNIGVIEERVPRLNRGFDDRDNLLNDLGIDFGTVP